MDHGGNIYTTDSANAKNLDSYLLGEPVVKCLLACHGTKEKESLSTHLSFFEMNLQLLKPCYMDVLHIFNRTLSDVAPWI